MGDSEMGDAATPYAHIVRQRHPILPHALPDAGLVFDTLLKRKEFVRHPAGLSSLMFSFAALVTHTVFRTSHENVNINTTSSYFDLAPLYGHNEETDNRIRWHKGHGRIFPDSFAEDRLMLLPPAVCVLLVLFSRNHNYIANKLLEINERETYTKGRSIIRIAPDDLELQKKISDQDEDIFQTARLINCAWFRAAFFSDYFGGILGLVRQGSTSSHNPFTEIRDSDYRVFERDRGNVCSVEFNCLYRWHATTSEADEKWVEGLMSKIFSSEPIDDLSPSHFKNADRKIRAEEPDLSHWTFGMLQRGPDGSFNDGVLASIIKDAVEHPAATFGARGTPHSMRLHEIMGIEANRRWGVCSLNEFREFLGLKPYVSFLDWNSNKEIAEAAELLYSHINYLELYVGLQGEEAKTPIHGAGLCPGDTMSRAILCDAIALTRGDRCFTEDFTPLSLTSWGFADSQCDPKGPGNGSMLGRLILRCLPGQFSENSIYTWFPLQTPDSMKVFLGKLGNADRYDFNRPPDPAPIAIEREYNAIQQILGSPQFRRPYGEKGARIVSGEGFFLASKNDAESQHDQCEILRVLQTSPERVEQITDYFYTKTCELINVKSYLLSDKNIKFVDIVRDVLRYVPLHWVATELAGLTLKADNKSWGDYTEPQLYEMVAEIYSFLFLDVDPSKLMDLEARAKEHIEDLQGHIKAKILAKVGGKLAIAGLAGTIQSLFLAKAKKQRLSLAESLFESGASADRITNNVLSLLVGASIELSQSIINVVNFYLDQHDVVEYTALESYTSEAMRIDPPFRGVYRESLAEQTLGNLTLFKGQRVFLDIAHANTDPNVFPNPRTVNLNRQSYLTDDGVTRTLGAELTTKTMSQMLRAVFELSGVRRTQGLEGRLKRYNVNTENTLRYEYLGADSLPTPWPSTMVLQYDAAAPRVNIA